MYAHIASITIKRQVMHLIIIIELFVVNTIRRKYSSQQRSNCSVHQSGKSYEAVSK